jgi:hypothetical protein
VLGTLLSVDVLDIGRAPVVLDGQARSPVVRK